MLIYLFTVLSFIITMPSRVKTLQRPIQPNSIRSVDFGNFMYSLPSGLIDRSNPRRTFRLKNREHPETPDEIGIFLCNVSYQNPPKNTPSIAEGLDGDESGIVGASPTINIAYNVH
jgi:hypothetical protein